MRFPHPFSLIVLPLLAFVAGCGGSGGREKVSGTVTFQGKPLDAGNITFLAVSESSPTSTGAMITDGKYEIPRDKGLVPGKYKVAISSPDGKTPDPSSDAMPGPSGNFASKDRIPAEFNLESKLEAEVKKGGTNTFDFKIP